MQHTEGPRLCAPCDLRRDPVGQTLWSFQTHLEGRVSKLRHVDRRRCSPGVGRFRRARAATVARVRVLQVRALASPEWP